MKNQVTEQVKEYYSRVLSGSNDLKTDACCALEKPPPHIREALALISDEVIEKFYGCGSPIPPAIEGCTVLDLGCGTGRDVFICSKFVGAEGQVIGVDMTPDQIEVARRNAARQAERFGFQRPNTAFHQGYIEDLAAAGIADESIDVVISNCVLNLSPDKERVFSEIFRVLKPGGELLFSDVFADRRLPAEWLEDQVLVGECLAGAMYEEDFRRLLLHLGVADYRIVSSRPIALDNTEIETVTGNARFRSLTVRAFKLDALEDRCEDYGQVATYLGTIPAARHCFVLDDHHEFPAAKPALVCGNTAMMLSETRLAPHFQVIGDRSHHFGLSHRGPEVVEAPTGSGSVPCTCC